MSQMSAVARNLFQQALARGCDAKPASRMRIRQFALLEWSLVGVPPSPDCVLRQSIYRTKRERRRARRA